VSAMEALFKTICSCLTYLEGDEATFFAVYACFVAIKFHTNANLMDEINHMDELQQKLDSKFSLSRFLKVVPTSLLNW